MRFLNPIVSHLTNDVIYNKTHYKISIDINMINKFTHIYLTYIIFIWYRSKFNKNKNVYID